MKSKSHKSFFDNPKFKIILKLSSIVIAAVILVFSSLTIINVNAGEVDKAPSYLIWIFIASGLMSLIAFFKNRTKLNLLRFIILFAFNIVLGVIVLFARSNPFMFSLTAGLYCVNLVFGCVINIIENRKIRSTIFNGLIIAFAIAMGIGLLISPIEETEQLQNIILVECVFIAAVSFIQAAVITFENMKFRVLFKIMLSTFSLEIIFGLVMMVVFASLIFMKVEPAIQTFPDGLWYCFAIVTTIGFGDFYAVTPIGRLLSVLLGIYGIIVVSVITSIAVNFYNETSGKNSQNEIREIIKEEKKN